MPEGQAPDRIEPKTLGDYLEVMSKAVFQFGTSSRLVLPLILLAAFAVYAPTLNDWFLADDFWFLRRSQTTSWGTWLVQAWDYRDSRPVPEFGQYRPLYLLTFRAEYSLFGLDAVGYHTVNVAAHLASVALLWLVAMRLSGRVWAAHLAALIFALHPAYAVAVAWVANGNTAMATVFYLLSFLLFMKYADGGPRRLLYHAVFLLSFMAALLYHPVVAPLAVVLPVWYFLMRSRPADALRPESWLHFVPLALATSPYLAILWWVREHDLRQLAGSRVGYHMYDNYIDYAGLSVFPTVGESAALPFAAAAMLLLSGALLTQWRWSWLSVFAVFWYYTALAPNSVLVPGAFGRLLYLPGAALAFLLMTAAMRLVDLSSSGLFKAPLRPLRQAAPYLALVALLPAVVLFLQARGSAAKIFPVSSDTVEKQAAANKDFIRQLRVEVPTIDLDGTLYVVRAPFNLTIFDDRALDSLVELYYGEVEVKSVRLGELEQTRAALRPQDRLFVFELSR